jgi:16S rRNA (cytidine1402-2'-O)-methyltransferase
VGAINSYSTALAAAHDAAGKQHYPQPALYMVATPIGNLADISLRALHVLELADTLACEDTRHTQALLRAYGIEKPPGRLLPLHQHNESHASQNVIVLLQKGERVAYVSDAGTPGISDPGMRLAGAVRQAGFSIVPLPGASSVTALLSAAGAGASAGPSATLLSGFVFQGFLPSKAKERESVVQTFITESRCIVLLEAPHRITATCAALVALGERPITIGRELTKQFEEIATMAAADLPAWLLADANRERGEFSLAIHPAELRETARDGQRILQLLLDELPLKTAVKLAAQITGEARNELYDLALALKANPS